MSRSRLAALLALSIALIPSLLPRLRHPIPSINNGDFAVYYLAASLVRDHHPLDMYDGADTGEDPQARRTDPASRLGQAAHKAGFAHTGLYLYPPTLADLLLPFTLLSEPAAARLWSLCLVAALAPVTLLLAPLCGLGRLSWQTLALFFALAITSSFIDALAYGQITVAMLLLCTVGLVGYLRGWQTASAAAFALAAALKLIPAIVLVPMLLFRDWRWLRRYLVALAAIVALVCLISRPASITDYVAHVLPSMSEGLPTVENYTVPAATQVLGAALRGDVLLPDHVPTLPHAVVLAGKLISFALVLGMALWLARRRARLATPVPAGERGLILSLFLVLAVVLSPVSWLHGYVLCFPALCLLWAETFLQQVRAGWLVLLTVCTLVLSSYSLSELINRLIVLHVHSLTVALLNLVVPLAGVVLVFSRVLAQPFAAATTELTGGATPLRR